MMSLKNRFNILKATAVVTYKEWAAYRTHSLISVFVGPAYLLVQISIWKAVYSQGGSFDGVFGILIPACYTAESRTGVGILPAVSVFALCPGHGIRRLLPAWGLLYGYGADRSYTESLCPSVNAGLGTAVQAWNEKIYGSGGLNMRRSLRIYGRYIRLSFSSAAAYRANFISTVCISMLGNLLVPLLTVLIYAGGAEIPGWTMPEALLIQSVFMLCTGLCAPFFNNMVWITMSHIREGTYDIIMLKPVSAIFLTIVSAFDIENIGVLIGGAVMFVYSVLDLPGPVAFGNWLQFVLLFLMGVSMTLGCILLMTASTFKWVGNSRIYEIFDAMTMFGRYPGTIFSSLLKGLSTYMIPVAMMGYIPAAAVL